MTSTVELILVVLGTILPCLGLLVILAILVVVILLIQQNRQKD